MKPRADDTGGPRSFPTTRPSFVERMASPEQAERERAAEALVRSYWKPAYKYLRLRHRRGDADAADLTQAFLAHALEKGWLARFDPARGRFRSFLRLSLDGFVANDDKARARQKRGGDRALLRLDFAAAEGELAGLEPPAPDSAEDWFEREWRRELFASSLAALERSLETRGHAVRLAVFRRYDLADSERPTYAELGRELGIDATAVTNHLAAARRELRAILVERLREETADEEEFRRELGLLLGR